jgi:hypothetical protein
MVWCSRSTRTSDGVADVAADGEDALVRDLVEDVEPVATAVDQSGPLQHRQVPRRWLAAADDFEDVRGRSALALEAVQDLEPAGSAIALSTSAIRWSSSSMITVPPHRARHKITMR